MNLFSILLNLFDPAYYARRVAIEDTERRSMN